MADTNTSPQQTPAVQRDTNSPDSDEALAKEANVPPSKPVLDDAMQIPIFSSDGKEHLFGTVLKGPGSQKAKRTLVLFIRHFFCGSCQDFIHALSASITSPETLPKDTNLLVIGCGAPSLIQMYKETTGCPFPIYTDPEARLYSLFGMLRTLDMGQKAPEYSQRSIFSLVMSGIGQSLKRVPAGDVLSSGDKNQVGGEFLFETETGANGTGDVKVTWCHRMQNTRDHTEIPALRRLVGLDT